MGTSARRVLWLGLVILPFVLDFYRSGLRLKSQEVSNESQSSFELAIDAFAKELHSSIPVNRTGNLSMSPAFMFRVGAMRLKYETATLELARAIKGVIESPGRNSHIPACSDRQLSASRKDGIDDVIADHVIEGWNLRVSS